MATLPLSANTETGMEVPARAPAGAGGPFGGFEGGWRVAAVVGRASAAPGSLCCTPRCGCQLESCSSCSPKIDLIISIPSVPVFLKFFVFSTLLPFGVSLSLDSVVIWKNKGPLLSKQYIWFIFKSTNLISPIRPGSVGKIEKHLLTYLFKSSLDSSINSSTALHSLHFHT